MRHPSKRTWRNLASASTAPDSRQSVNVHRSKRASWRSTPDRSQRSTTTSRRRSSGSRLPVRRTSARRDPTMLTRAASASSSSPVSPARSRSSPSTRRAASNGSRCRATFGGWAVRTMDGTVGSRAARRPLPGVVVAVSTVRSVPHVLEGIRVVDVTTGPVGGIATMVLADFGADVVKVEPPGGDRFRAAAAAPLWLRGKRSVTADLATAAGLADLHGLVPRRGRGRRLRSAVAGAAVGRRRRRGDRAAAATSCTARSPAGVRRGPLAEVPGWDAAVAARSGRMMAFERQLRRGGPVFAAVPVASHVAAHGAVQGIVAGAVRPRPRRRRRSASRRACCRACCRSTSSSCCSSRWPSAAASRRRTSPPSAATCRR